jgi:hypothetical protein
MASEREIAPFDKLRVLGLPFLEKILFRLIGNNTDVGIIEDASRFAKRGGTHCHH